MNIDVFIARKADLRGRPELVQHFLADPDLRADALTNPTLPASNLAETLALTGKNKLSATERDIIATKQPMDDATLDLFIGTTTSVRALTSVLAAQDIRGDTDPRRIAAVAAAAPKISKTMLSALQQRGADTALLRDMAQTVGGRDWLDVLVSEAMTTAPADIVTQLQALDDWAGGARLGKGMGKKLRVLMYFGGREAEFAVARSSDTAARAVAAGVTELDEQIAHELLNVVPDGDGWRFAADPSEHEELDAMLRGLLHNPYCPADVLERAEQALQHPTTRIDIAVLSGLRDRLKWKPEPLEGPVEEIDDPKQLKWLMHRATSSENAHKRAGVDFMPLLRNPNITDEQVDMMRGNLQWSVHEALYPAVDAAWFERTGEHCFPDVTTRDTDSDSDADSLREREPSRKVPPPRDPKDVTGIDLNRKRLSSIYGSAPRALADALADAVKNDPRHLEMATKLSRTWAGDLAGLTRAASLVAVA